MYEIRPGNGSCMDAANNGKLLQATGRPEAERRVRLDPFITSEEFGKDSSHTVQILLIAEKDLVLSLLIKLRSLIKVKAIAGLSIMSPIQIRQIRDDTY